MDWIYDSIGNLRTLCMLTSAISLVISFILLIKYDSAYTRMDKETKRKMMILTMIALSISVFFEAIIPSEKSINNMKDSYLMVSEN